MPDDVTTDATTTPDEPTPTDRTAGASDPAQGESPAEAPAKPARRTAKKSTTRKTAASGTAASKRAASKTAASATAAGETAASESAASESAASESAAGESAASESAAAKTAAKKTTAKKTTTRRTAAKKAAAADEQLPLQTDPVDPTAAEPTDSVSDAAEAPAGATPAKKTATKRTAAKTTAKKTTAKKTTAKKTASKKSADEAIAEPESAADSAAEATTEATTEATPVSGAPAVLFQAPEPTKAAPRKRTRKAAATPAQPADAEPSADDLESPTAPAEADAEAAQVAGEVAPEDSAAAGETADVEQAEGSESAEAEAPDDTEDSADTEDTEDSEDSEDSEDTDDTEDSEGGSGARRRRRRGGRRRRKSGGGDAADAADAADPAEAADAGVDADPEAESEADDEAAEQTGEGGTSRRRRRRRRSGDSGSDTDEDSDNTVTRVRQSRSAEDQITSLAGSTRLEAKKQRRREGREAGRRRAPIVSEAEFLARRESVDRVMVIRQRGDLTQIAVLEDKVLVEHYVARESQTSIIGNVYLGRVQNVLPSMEAAFIDIGKGRNAVLYAGEVNWSALGHKDGQPRKIESVLSPGQSVLVQVTKDPVGHKGARLTSQISLAGRFLVYVPDGTTSGISRKLPDTERNRLKSLLKEIVPDSAGVIVRTAAEGASEEELTRDVERLKARWEDIEAKAKGSAPQLLYGEPDLTLKVVRDLFTEDFSRLVIQGDDAWDTVQAYVVHVAPDLEERLERFEPDESGPPAARDAFAAYRIDEQIAKGLDRKVWLPSGGSLIIDRTEAMTVVDVNTGKFTGSGGNLEETVTKNNLEAAEEIVRQLRLRDIGGIIVVDFIDMVLESNRDLVLRRLVECLGRDRTRHQVAEVTSLGLVQMTRKRIGTGLLEAFSENCEHCHGRGVVVHEHPIDSTKGVGVGVGEEPRRARRSRGGKGRNGAEEPTPVVPTPKDIAAMPRQEPAGDAAPAADTVVDPISPAAAEAGGRTGDATARRSGAGSTGEVADGTAAPARRSRKRAAKPAAADGAPATDQQPVEQRAEQPAEQPVEQRAEQPAEQPAGETARDGDRQAASAPEPTAEPAAPKVVTRTRARSGASRPVVTTGEATVVEAAPVATVAVPEVSVSAPEPPKVVTRTRRGASRTVVTADGAGSPDPQVADQGTGEPVSGGGPAGEDEPHVEHVPVKKKGSRKR